MTKKFFALFIITAILLSACGDTAQSTENTQAAPQTTSTTEALNETEHQTVPTAEPPEATSSDGSIDVEQGLLNVELTIPKDLVGEATQEDLDAVCAEYGFKSIILNEDGSATYTMSKQQHQELLEEYRAQTNASLAEMVGSEDYPTFTDIKSNDDFTEFTVTTTSTELDMQESFSVIQFYLYGGLYAAFNGTPDSDISVTFINADSGKVIKTANSSEMN
ncbi:MAG: hypothetical protein HFI38_05800 [Lachnospiraceae bacterium]|jgi:hypothetical protein|nr:hypothetical protein [Lachnospiraceae bacterium]